MSEISKGMLALRKSNTRAERVVVGGDTFYFRKLTIAMEEELDLIIKNNQDETLKVPEQPAENSEEAVIRKWANDMLEFKQRSNKVFRKLTAEIMRYVLLDEGDKPLFTPEDDIFADLDNVYAATFFKAYNKFRNGAEVNPAVAEDKFPK